MTAVDHAELKRLAEEATPGPWEWDEQMNPFYNDPDGRSCGGDGTGLAEFYQTDASGETLFDDKGEVLMVLPWKFNNAAFIAAANPAVVLELLSEIEGLKAERDVLEVERLGLRAAIFGSHDYDPALRHASFIEMARLTEDARKGALSRATEAERQLAALRTQAPDSWRPIETAPKDGVVMGWGEYLERDGFSPAFMRYYESCGWTVNAMPFYPTHWMPLPAAPALRPQTAESGKCARCFDCLKDERDALSGLPITAMRMIVCPDCGNKRCPKATNHANACTGSNEPGQPGSRYA